MVTNLLSLLLRVMRRRPQTVDEDFEESRNSSREASEALEDANSYLTNRLKRRRLNSYFVKSRSQFTELQEDEFEPSEQSSVDTEQLSGAQQILFDLARDPDLNIRASIAENDQTPSLAMWILLEDESSLVRSRLATNLRCPIAILELLGNDKELAVALKAKRTMRRIWKESQPSIACGKLSETHESTSENDDLLREVS